MNMQVFLIMSAIIWLPALCTLVFDILFAFLPITKKWFLYYLMPGVVIHEMSHAIVAVLTGQKIAKIHLFQLPSSDGTMGYVVHEYNPLSLKDQLIGNGLVAISPAYVLGGIVIILFEFAVHGSTICLIILLVFGLSFLNGMRLSKADWMGAWISITFWIILSFIVAYLVTVFS